ncbi:hypothetical protein OJ963_33575 [Streptomyces sp. RS2]|uniref:hypothetical protein n=1 Tax=Streptomyces sp. RS2 TaxID=1451205 RepID=UPI0021F83EC7|nr:hypothetical protein [Streptomyces sp. RS2]MCW1098770.1 hypothetical protein [Streptomyces sp. RS2]
MTATPHPVAHQSRAQPDAVAHQRGAARADPHADAEPAHHDPATSRGRGATRAARRAGAGVYTVPSEGGKATVRFGGGGVCLISAVPNQGFTVSTEQSTPQTLKVTFSASRHRSEITATTQPQSRADVREVSW